MSFEKVRQKLSRESTERYNSMKEVVSDIRLVFKNAYIFNPVSTFFLVFIEHITCRNVCSALHVNIHVLVCTLSVIKIIVHVGIILCDCQELKC